MSVMNEMAASSVGEAVASRGMFSIDHPQYKMLEGAVAQRLAEVAAERAAARTAATALPMAVAVSTSEYAALTELFPEFSLVQYGFYRPGHSYWVQVRRLANEWLMTQAARYGTSVLHLGGSVASYLLTSELDAQIMVDTADPVAVHEHHAQTVESFRYFSDFASVGDDLGRVLPRAKYEQYLRGESVRVVPADGRAAAAEIVLADLTLTLVSPTQLAATMLEVGASVAFGFFIYTPNMLIDDVGEIGSTGVRFKRGNFGIALQYPEGPGGTTFMDYRLWEPWLVSHTFAVGSLKNRRYFQLELLKNRGHVMFFRLVALDCAPAAIDVSHALDVDTPEEMYVVTVPELVSAVADPKLASSWVVHPTMVPARVVDRAYNDAMSLSRNQFTSYGVRTKIAAANDRIVVNGTSVQVNSPLGLAVVQRVTLAVTSRAFVDRYEAGRMTAEVMQVAKRFFGRRESADSRLSRLLRAMAATFRWPFARLDGVMSVVAEWIEGVFGREHHAQPGEFGRPVGYVRLGENCDTMLRGVRAAGPEVLVAYTEPVRGLPGFLVTELAIKTAASAVVQPLRTGWSMLLGPGGSATSAVYSGGGGTVEPLQPDVGLRGYETSEQQLFDEPEASESADRFVDAVKQWNVVESGGATTFDVTAETVVGERAPERVGHVELSSDPVGEFNRFYRNVNPGVAPQRLEDDTASIALDPQDRYVTANRMVLPQDMSSVPKPRRVYESRIEALNVSKRQNTLQELLSATAARNLSAPQVSLPQDEDAAVREVWKCFLETACVADAPDKLARYQADPVALTDEGLRGWAAAADPRKLERATRAIEECAQALEDYDIGEYMMMLKADVKPDLTRKPIFSRIEPQVIVYHRTELNALYSAIFRVLVRRFLSLLKPNVKLVLMKDMKEVERMIQNVHPFGLAVKYIENDFSKYDKSQGRFVYLLEAFVFEQLGMNEALLSHWLGGHKTSRIRSVALGISLHVDYQRKSGDATTAFGNGLLNVLSVMFAYRGTDVIWAVFMGDDSLVCTRGAYVDRNAVQILAEVFNLGAKTFVVDQPYFASNFLVIDSANAVARFVPDPVKRIARWSMSVSADDPNWHERWVSARDACSAYLDEVNVSAMPPLVAARYDVAEGFVGPAVRAVATVVHDEKAFRSMWQDEPVTITYG